MLTFWVAVAAVATVVVAGSDDFPEVVKLNDDGTMWLAPELLERMYQNNIGIGKHESHTTARRSGGSNPVAERELEVATTSGVYRGFYGSDGGTAQWRGIRYGEISQRFERSQLASYTTGVTDATAYGPACPQPAFNAILPGSYYILPNQAEDCLFLTVRAPRYHRNRGVGHRIPVSIHIKGDTPHTNAVQVEDTTGLAATGDAITVEFNHRTSYTTLPILDGYESTMANNHWYDQQKAIEWVAANIHNFGGDPSRITLVGEFSKGGDVLRHIGTNSGTPQPNRVMLMNMAHYHDADLASTKAITLEWAAAAPRHCNQSTSVNTLACLRAVSIMDLMDLSGLPPTWHPPRATTVPGTAFAQQPTEIIESGQYNKNVDVMVGYPKSTGVSYSLAIPLFLFNTYIPFASMTQQQFTQFIAFYHGFRVEYGAALVPQILQVYGALAAQPGENFGTALAKAIDEPGYHCFANWVAQRFDNDGVKVYAFTYTHSPDSPSNPFPELVGNPGYGSLASAFYQSAGPGNFQYHSGFSTFETDQLFPTMQRWLTNFFQNGNPRNGWENFKTNDQSGDHGFNIIGDASVNATQMGPIPDYGTRCAFWGANIPEVPATAP